MSATSLSGSKRQTPIRAFCASSTASQTDSSVCGGLGSADVVRSPVERGGTQRQTVSRDESSAQRDEALSLIAVHPTSLLDCAEKRPPLDLICWLRIAQHSLCTPYPYRGRAADDKGQTEPCLQDLASESILSGTQARLQSVPWRNPVGVHELVHQVYATSRIYHCCFTTLSAGHTVSAVCRLGVHLGGCRWMGVGVLTSRS